MNGRCNPHPDSRCADGGTGIGIDVAHLVTTFLDNLPPPGLFHLVDIGYFLNRSGVPGGISLWNETLEC